MNMLVGPASDGCMTDPRPMDDRGVLSARTGFVPPLLHRNSCSCSTCSQQSGNELQLKQKLSRWILDSSNRLHHQRKDTHGPIYLTAGPRALTGSFSVIEEHLPIGAGEHAVEGWCKVCNRLLSETRNLTAYSARILCSRFSKAL
jgi:hypothetical protein